MREMGVTNHQSEESPHAEEDRPRRPASPVQAGQPRLSRPRQENRTKNCSGRPTLSITTEVNVAAIATALVIGSLWLLDQLDVVAVDRLRTHLARAALLVVVITMFAVPTAYRNGLTWFIDRKTNELLERIQPLLDELTPPDETDNTDGLSHG